MKLPWSSSQTPPEKPTNKKSTQANIKTSSKIESPVLRFNGKNYDANSLSDEILGLIRSLRVADEQISRKKDAMKVLAIARNSIGKQIKEKLKTVSPIP